MSAEANRDEQYRRALATAGRLLGQPLTLPLGGGEPPVGDVLAVFAVAGQSRAG